MPRQPFIRPAIRRMAGYVPGEQPQGGGFIKLNTNENPYPPSAAVRQAIADCAGEDVRLYPDPMANALRDAAARCYGLSREQILAGNGSDDLLAMIMRLCVDPGDRVVYPMPTYSLYDTLVEIAGGTIVHLAWPADWALPADVAAANGRVTIICNPNAPSGTFVPVEALDRLAREVAGLLVIDEAYVDFAADSALRLVRQHDNLLVLRTLSKSFSLAGMRVGLAFGQPQLIDELAKVKDSYNLSRVSIAAGTAALSDADTVRAHVARVAATRARLIAGLRGLGYAVPDSQANFVLARRPGVDQRPIYDALKARKILVRYFNADGLRDALRITVGTDAEIDALLAALGDQHAH
ncbi:MAG: histidinol-phosphate transaminase [Deltaproteobacteria bacterium]|nr:histidinol-phosphate transaminase [Deltaproteobacteria bacterium]